MPQTGPRFRGSDKAALYRSVIALTEDDYRTAKELLPLVGPRFNPSPTMSGFKAMLSTWAAAGGLVAHRTARDVAGGYQLEYRSTSKALTPVVIKSCLGPYADELLDDVNEAELSALRRREALIASGRGGRTEAVALVEDLPPEPMRSPIHEPEKDPDRFFAASMGPDGVTITYDEYFRVVALLKRFSEGQVQ